MTFAPDPGVCNACYLYAHIACESQFCTCPTCNGRPFPREARGPHSALGESPNPPILESRRSEPATILS